MWISKLSQKIFMKRNFKYMLHILMTKLRREICKGILLIVNNLITIKSILML